MAVAVVMPKVGITVETCIIGSWNKKPGDSVSVGESLFSYETDKAAFECESTASGTLLEVYYGDGDEVPVLAPVCAIGEPGEKTPDMQAAQGATDVPGAEKSGMPAVQGGAYESAGGAHIMDALKISPRAKNLAARFGLDYTLAIPSGPGGRIIERDIEALNHINKIYGHGDAQSKAGLYAPEANRESFSADPQSPAAAPPVETALSNAAVPPTATIPSGAAAPSAAAVSSTEEPAALKYSDEKLPKIRRVISQTMTKSLSEMAQLTHHHSFDASAILALRAEFKQHGAQFGADGVTLGDIVLYAVSRVLPMFPNFNAHIIGGDTIRRFEGVNLGVAIDTKRGLMVPTVFGADKKSLRQISAEVKELAQAARNGSINPDALSGGTFTVSNLGATGVEMFTPIINPPQVAILGVCGITPRVRAAQGGGVEVYQSMGLSITYDHRANDGAPASSFAQKLCQTLEHITLLFTI